MQDMTTRDAETVRLARKELQAGAPAGEVIRRIYARCGSHSIAAIQVMREVVPISLPTAKELLSLVCQDAAPADLGLAGLQRLVELRSFPAPWLRNWIHDAVLWQRPWLRIEDGPEGGLRHSTDPKQIDVGQGSANFPLATVRDELESVLADPWFASDVQVVQDEPGLLVLKFTHLSPRRATMALLPDHAHVFILSGAGLSKASGIPTFRDASGLWEGHDPMQVATPGAWRADANVVRTFYDARRLNVESCEPNPGHTALAALQRALGPSRVSLVTQNVDGMLEVAGAPQVIEMHGSLRWLRCEHSEDHPTSPVVGRQDPEATCSTCGGRLRPAIVWFGEIPMHMDAIESALRQCTHFVSVGTSGQVYPAAGLVRAAKAVGAHCIEINPEPTAALYDEVLKETSEIALPKLVAEWIGEPLPGAR